MHGKVFTACALGGGIGTLVALQANPLFWWVGLLVGGLVGYLTYDFKEVVKAVPRAGQMAVAGVCSHGVVDALLNTWALFYFLTVMTLPIFTSFVLIFWLLAAIDGGPPLMSLTTALLACVGGGHWFAYPSFVYCLFVGAWQARDREKPREIFDDFSWRTFNPFSVYFYYLPKAIWWMVKRVPKASWIAISASVMGIWEMTKLLGSFVIYLFLLIHSEMRLLCAADAALGAAVGYFSGNALIGALAGGVIGVLNFEIVSKRLLKLVPVEPAKPEQ